MPKRRRSSIPDLASITSALNMHRSRYSDLMARVADVERSLTAAESALASISGNGATGKRRGRPPGSGRKAGAVVKPARARRGRPTGAGRRAKGQDLATFITKALSGTSKPMGIAEITAAVKRAGYVSTSASLPKIVGMRLGGNRAFKRAGRGLYKLA